MGTPRPQSPPLLKPPVIPLPPPPPPLSPSSPPHDFSFSFSFSLSPPLPSSPPPFHVHLPLPVRGDMSRTPPPPPLGRVGSDLSHNNYAKANHHQTTIRSGSSSEDKERDKNKASPFFSGLGLGGAWRPSGESSSRDHTAEDKPRKGNVGQRLKKYMACLVEQLLASFSGHGERERRRRRRRPHSFSVPRSGPGGACTRDQRERWRRQRRGQLASAPASLRASPVNSGHLSVCGGGSVKVSTSSEESTMEELQSAIQAAIAHCKNSHRPASQLVDARGPPGLPGSTTATTG